MANKSINTNLILQIFVALLLLSFGIEGLTGYNSTGSELLRGINKMFGGSNNLLPLIFAIVEIVAGALLILEFFVPVTTKFVFIAMIVICFIWLFSIVTGYFTSRFLEPNFISWLSQLSVQLILLASFWQVGQSKR